MNKILYIIIFSLCVGCSTHKPVTEHSEPAKPKEEQVILEITPPKKSNYNISEDYMLEALSLSSEGRKQIESKGGKPRNFCLSTKYFNTNTGVNFVLNKGDLYITPGTRWDIDQPTNGNSRWALAQTGPFITLRNGDVSLVLTDKVVDHLKSLATKNKVRIELFSTSETSYEIKKIATINIKRENLINILIAYTEKRASLSRYLNGL